MNWREKKSLLLIFILCLALTFFYLYGVENVYSNNQTAPTVIENITYDPNMIYTYTYTIDPLQEEEIWWWGIYFDKDPEAILDDSTVSHGFAPTDLEDCPEGWKNTAPEQRMGFYLYSGPNGELGFYSTYANDFKSENPPNIGYMEGGGFVPLNTYEEVGEALENGSISEEDLEGPWLGGIWGWDGANANIVTHYGISSATTADNRQYVIRSKEFFPGPKTFFYNTIDYWNSWYEYNESRDEVQLVIGGFEDLGSAELAYEYYRIQVEIQSNSRKTFKVTVQLQGTDINNSPVKQAQEVQVSEQMKVSLNFYVLNHGEYLVIAFPSGESFNSRTSKVNIDANYTEDKKIVWTVDPMLDSDGGCFITSL